MKAIITKYHGAGNVRGARVSAKAEGGHRISIPYPYEKSGEAVHREAAEALCVKMGWPTTLVGGGLPDQSGYAFCFLPKS